MSTETRSGFSRIRKSKPDWRFGITIALIAIALATVFRAAFSAYFLLDDFGMLSIVRFLDNPFEPFARNHIPGGIYYRPVGMLFWWLSERWFGAEAFAHYLINLLLHAAVAVALGSLVARLCGNRWVGLIAGACFVLHPIGIGTSLWLSDRFDLLALLFGTLGLRAALDFSRSGARRSLWLMLGLLGISLLSKEISLACFAAAGAICLRPADPSRSRQGIWACLVLLLLVAVYALVRSLVLVFPVASPLMAADGVMATLKLGLANWLTGWTDYLFLASRLNGYKLVLSISGFTGLLVIALLAMWQPWGRGRQQAILAGIVLWISTAVLQSPLLAHFGVYFHDKSPIIESVVNARYFYVSLAGFLIALAALLAPLLARAPWTRAIVLSALALLMLPWLSTSQTLAHRYRNETRQLKTVVQAANRAIGAIEIPASGCQVYLLGTSSWSFGWISDEAIKATHPSLDRISHCLIQTEHTPWYHIAILDGVDLDSLRPLSIVQGDDQISTLQPIGRAHFLVLNLDVGTRIPAGSHARFFDWQNDGFVDVTDEILRGLRSPNFVCNRRADHCPSSQRPSDQ
ncbi:MAG: hypothetical protein IPP82_18465 [Xanthomonadales bacterium]|nr:hypothetical protein [Xanthomonadales bacterium]